MRMNSHSTGTLPLAMSLLQFAIFLVLLPTLALAEKLVCPDTTDDLHHRDVMATSAPEIKVLAKSQEDTRRWTEIVRPLTQKAMKMAKIQRATLIEDGVEHGCSMPHVYVGRILPNSDMSSGCDHRVVTRPAETDHIWVQVVATCKYDWSCCTPEEDKSTRTGTGNAVGYTLEGPLSPKPSAPPKH
jgi:hypothetical protein